MFEEEKRRTFFSSSKQQTFLFWSYTLCTLCCTLVYKYVGNFIIFFFFLVWKRAKLFCLKLKKFLPKKLYFLTLYGATYILWINFSKWSWLVGWLFGVFLFIFYFRISRTIKGPLYPIYFPCVFMKKKMSSPPAETTTTATIWSNNHKKKIPYIRCGDAGVCTFYKRRRKKSRRKTQKKKLSFPITSSVQHSGMYYLSTWQIDAIVHFSETILKWLWLQFF